jgi:hypothetical protein
MLIFVASKYCIIRDNLIDRGDIVNWLVAQKVWAELEGYIYARN